MDTQANLAEAEATTYSDRPQLKLVAPPGWSTAKRFALSSRTHLRIASSKFLWNAATLLGDAESLEVQTNGGLGKYDTKYGALGLYFISDSAGDGPEPLAPEVVLEKIAPYLGPSASALFLLLCAPCCDGAEPMILDSRQILRLLNLSTMTKSQRLKHIAELARIVNALALQIDHWPSEGTLPSFTLPETRIFEVGVRVFSNKKWIYLDGLKLDAFDFTRAKRLELLVTPGAWRPLFFSKARMQYTRIGVDLPAAIIASRRLHDRSSLAFIYLIFTLKARGGGGIWGSELAMVFANLSRVELDGLSDDPQKALAIAKAFDRFLIRANEFYKIFCDSRRFKAACGLQFSSDGVVTENVSKTRRRPNGYLATYLGVQISFVPWKESTSKGSDSDDES